MIPAEPWVATPHPALVPGVAAQQYWFRTRATARDQPIEEETMQAIATTTTHQREQNEQARVRALVRFNGLTFHSLAMASFLETAVPSQAGRLARSFSAQPDVRLWLEQIWWPQ